VIKTVWQATDGRRARRGAAAAREEKTRWAAVFTSPAARVAQHGIPVKRACFRKSLLGKAAVQEGRVASLRPGTANQAFFPVGHRVQVQPRGGQIAVFLHAAMPCNGLPCPCPSVIAATCQGEKLFNFTRTQRRRPSPELRRLVGAEKRGVAIHWKPVSRVVAT
jgi:hypothetical protein